MKNSISLLFLRLIRLCATLQLTKVRPIIVGVTGSAGKSSTVVAIACVLQEKYVVKWTKKGNSETGIPLEILSIPIKNFSFVGWLWVAMQSVLKVLFDWRRYDILVAEMGIDSEKSPKNMEYLLTFLRPTVGVFLNVNAVHALNFSGKDPVKTIAEEKGKLLTALPKEGLAIMNQDIEDQYHLSSSIQSSIQTFSTEKKKGEFWLEKYSPSLSGTTFLFSDNNETYRIHFEKQLHIQEAFGGIMSAIMVGKYFSIPFAQSIQRLEKYYRLPNGRMSIIEGIHDSVILDSSYNSSPTATKGALELLGRMNGRKIAVLGDMRELGTQVTIEHERMAKLAEQYADKIVFVGPLTRKYSFPALSKKAQLHTQCFTTAHHAIEYVRGLVQKNDVVLVKGSQNTILLEIIVKAIMKNPQHARKILCRQSDYWEKERQKLLDV